IPSRTYPSVPCEIIHAGGKVKFIPTQETTLKGAYRLNPSFTWDCALRFTYNMYLANQFMCLSFTGPYKHLKLSKGGAILTDNHEAYLWFKRARFSGRRECSYHDDNLDMIGWNFYMMPEIAARGLLLMQQFYDIEGDPVHNEDKELPYPDLSQFSVYEDRMNVIEKILKPSHYQTFDLIKGDKRDSDSKGRFELSRLLSYVHQAMLFHPCQTA
ncbi:unnamed protein product, partial [marine sediment metagenome]